jgi:hypothetical protein
VVDGCLVLLLQLILSQAVVITNDFLGNRAK